MLGPEEFVVLTGRQPFMSLGTSPRLERGGPDMEVSRVEIEPSP
jgi:hypothetical protein